MMRKKIQITLMFITVLMFIYGCNGGNGMDTTSNTNNQVHTLLEVNPGHQMQESYALYEMGTDVDKSGIGPFNIMQTALYNNWLTTGNLPFTIVIENNPISRILSIITTIEQNGQRINSEFKYDSDSTKNSVKYNNYLVGPSLTQLITQPSSTSYFDKIHVNNKIVAWMVQNASIKCEFKGFIKSIPGKVQEPHKIWYITEITEGKLNNTPLTIAQLSNDFSIADSMRSLLNSFIAEPLFVSLN